MLRAFSLLVLAALLPLGACTEQAPTPKPAATPPSAAATPSALAATRAIYEGYAAAPDSFARLPHVSKFYLEDNMRKDAACQAGAGGDSCAVRAINAYKVLYDIEEKLRGKPPDEVKAVRQKESKPVLEALFAWAETYRETELPKSSLGRAVRYLLNHRKAFSRFLDDGVLPIDNGILERAHRRPAIGRRAYLFAGSDEGARRAAIAYTVLGTCRLNGINPTQYLADVLPKLARPISITRDLPALMPVAWKQARTVAASVGQATA